MTADGTPFRPLLQRHPDARRGSAPLLHPVLFPYLALIFGSLIAGIAGAYNAAVLRRGWLMVQSLLIGAAGWISFLFVVAALGQLGVENVSLAVIGGRVVHFALGGLLFFVHRPHFRGHEFLHGRTAPLLASYLVAIFASIYLPNKLELILLGVPFVR